MSETRAERYKAQRRAEIARAYERKVREAAERQAEELWFLESATHYFRENGEWYFSEWWPNRENYSRAAKEGNAPRATEEA